MTTRKGKGTEAAAVPPLSRDPYPGYRGIDDPDTIAEWKARQAEREANYQPPRDLTADWACTDPSRPSIGTQRRRGRSLSDAPEGVPFPEFAPRPPAPPNPKRNEATVPLFTLEAD